ncbi:MAG: hypothetical protein HRT45_13940 [Bdellovibrionales bacterium]|nr:hypothetical protein [Bdellovibrionales bacterium]
MSGDEAKKQPSAEEQHRSIRDLSQREYRFLKKLMTSYPGFGSLSAGDQLDRMILILQSACGYGAVSKRIVGQIQSELGWEPSFDIEGHFRSAEYNSAETAGTQTRYRESFEGAFCLKREFMNVLSNEGEEASSNEPIRKKVKAPIASVTPMKSRTDKSQANNSQAATSSANLTDAAITVETAAQADQPAEVNSSNEAELSNDFAFKPWMIIAAVGVLIVLVAVVFTVASK